MCGIQFYNHRYIYIYITSSRIWHLAVVTRLERVEDDSDYTKNVQRYWKGTVRDSRRRPCPTKPFQLALGQRGRYGPPLPIMCKQIVNEFKIDLQNRYAALEEQQDDSHNNISSNDMNNNITEPLIGAGKKWKSSTKRNSKFSEETKNFMEKRRNLKTPTTAKEKIEATELNKLIRKKQRNDLRKHKATTIQRVIEQGKSFKMAKRQLNRGRLQFTSVLEEDGTLTTDRERVVERSREFYEKLYSSTRHEPPEADIEQQFEGFPNIKAWEVKSAVKQSKKGKAPGPDNITIDLIDAAGDIINDKLATLFNECLIQSKVPEIWNEAIIILLHKKGDQKNISNYRPISLLNNIYKLFTKVITNRITRTLDENQPREQAGFRRGFSTIDHLHAVNQLIEKCAEYKIPLVVGLVDYNKAFDSVEIHDVIEALQEQEVDPVYVNVLSTSTNKQSHSLGFIKTLNHFKLTEE